MNRNRNFRNCSAAKTVIEPTRGYPLLVDHSVLVDQLLLSPRRPFRTVWGALLTEKLLEICDHVRPTHEGAAFRHLFVIQIKPQCVS